MVPNMFFELNKPVVMVSVLSEEDGWDRDKAKFDPFYQSPIKKLSVHTHTRQHTGRLWANTDDQIPSEYDRLWRRKPYRIFLWHIQSSFRLCWHRTIYLLYSSHHTIQYTIYNIQFTSNPSVHSPALTSYYPPFVLIILGGVCSSGVLLHRYNFYT